MKAEKSEMRRKQEEERQRKGRTKSRKMSHMCRGKKGPRLRSRRVIGGG